MTKKSFKESNPALQFISAVAEQSPAPRPDPSEIPQPPKTPPAPVKARTQGETKSKRLNLLVLPSVLDGLSKIARMQKTSVNDLINTVLKDYRDQQAALIARHDQVFGRE